jgi:hypothetical protein
MLARFIKPLIFINLVSSLTIFVLTYLEIFRTSGSSLGWIELFWIISWGLVTVNITSLSYLLKTPKNRIIITPIYLLFITVLGFQNTSLILPAVCMSVISFILLYLFSKLKHNFHFSLNTALLITNIGGFYLFCEI